MNRFSRSNWFSGLLALMFALLLFFNANAQGSSSNTNTKNQIYDEMVYNVPVNLEYDQSKYFVSGYEETVNVQLSSANRIQLNMEANEDTRNFQVVADLQNASLGTSEIPLRVKGISTAVNAEIEPATVTVTIEKKVTKSFTVTPQVPDTLEAEGYEVKNITVSPKKVDITTGEETMKAIDKVVAPLSSVKQAVDTIKQTVNIQALDSKGQALSIENPVPQVSVTVTLSLPKKEVPLSIVATGSPPSDVSYYTFDISDKNIEISGASSVLEAIDSLEVPVDVSNIRNSVKQKVRIPTSGEYVVSPSEVEVTINPIYSRASSSNSGSVNGQGDSSANKSGTGDSSSEASKPTTSSTKEESSETSTESTN